MYFQNYEPNIAVCDIGTEFIKIGYATHISPSYYENSRNQQNNYASPLIHSKIESIQTYFQLLNNIERFQTKDVLVCLNNEDRCIKGKILEHLYESNLCDNLLLHENKICDLYSYGKTSGLVISLSSSVSVIAIIDGLIVNRRDDPYGGYDATQAIKKHSTAIYEYIKHFKGENSYIDFIACEKAREIKENLFFYNTTIYNGNQVLDYCAVKNEILNRLTKNINTYVTEILDGVEDEVKYQLLGNIVITGGCAETNDMTKIINDVICKTYPQSKVKITYEKKHHTFVGASVFGSLGSTRCFYVGTKDYEEYGLNILDRKHFEWIKQ